MGKGKRSDLVNDTNINTNRLTNKNNAITQKRNMEVGQHNMGRLRKVSWNDFRHTTAVVNQWHL